MIPFCLMIASVAYNTLIDATNYEVSKTFLSASAFLIWIRVVHFMKVFTPTAHLLRMTTRILYRLRFVIYIIFVSVVSSGFAFYFLTEKGFNTPIEGLRYMFLFMLN